jgi:hypothetical protein
MVGDRPALDIVHHQIPRDEVMRHDQRLEPEHIHVPRIDVLFADRFALAADAEEDARAPLIDTPVSSMISGVFTQSDFGASEGPSTSADSF